MNLANYLDTWTIPAPPRSIRDRYTEARNAYSTHYQLCRIHDANGCAECMRLRFYMDEALKALDEEHTLLS